MVSWVVLDEQITGDEESIPGNRQKFHLKSRSAIHL